MKRFIPLTVLLLLLSSAVFATEKNNREIQVLPFEKLSISANITVILYESNDNSTVIVKGKEKHAKNIVVLQKNSKLMITSNNSDDLKDWVTVYVPVKKLKTLEVKNDAYVKSQTILDCPNLLIDADGLCEVHIIVNGNVHVKDGPNYSYVRSIKPEHVAMRLAMPVFY